MSCPNIYGFNSNSEMGMCVFAPTIFLKGCNLRCPYCMNLFLANGETSQKIDFNSVKEYVKENKSEWFSISGGEPTLQDSKKMCNLFKLVRSWGCKISLSTNGLNPKKLKIFIPYLDYVALDIKSSRNSDYNIMAGYQDNHLKKVMRSKELLDNTLNHFELRTTLYPIFIDQQALDDIGRHFISKNNTWILQQYRPVAKMFGKRLKPYNKTMLKKLLGIAKQYTYNLEMRYV